MKWYPVELHTHTQHSDGDFSVRALTESAKNRGFAALACTDHNTFAGQEEFITQAEKCGIVPIPGIEWTTYWGHMLVLGEQGYTDWRGVKPADIDISVEAIHKNKGLVGIAHPLAISSPIKTGYHWEFIVTNWDAIDFIEVWSRDNAPVKVQSYRTMQLWEQLLNRGCRITATSGRDWHREDNNPYVYTYVGIKENLTAQTIQDAIKKGSVCITSGPLLTMQISSCHGFIDIGGCVSSGKAEINLNLLSDTLKNEWDSSKICGEKINLVHNGKIIASCPADKKQSIECELSAGWLRADLIGSYYGHEKQCIAFTNPIFIG